MTSVIFYRIIEIALMNLKELPNEILTQYEPWLNKKYIKWCLKHYKDFRLGLEDKDERSTRILLQEVSTLLKEN